MKTLAVLRKYFGLQEGQSLAQFAAELKALSSEEKHVEGRPLMWAWRGATNIVNPADGDGPVAPLEGH